MWWLLITVISTTALVELKASRDFYTAAVFEHARFGTSNDDPQTVIDTNLNYFSRAARIAKSKGADVIVFPEYGIFRYGSRQRLKLYLETVPDPVETCYNPCLQPDLYAHRPILLRLSCIARNDSIVVVGNMGDIQVCKGRKECPSDGVFQYNTNVVFDRQGTLLVRYHKEHLYLEDAMDTPTHPQTPVFTTDFGTFATFVCFDSVFYRMSQVARWHGVEGVMFSTAWVDKFPQLVSIPYWEAWALGNGVALLAANVQHSAAIGSGVFHGQKGALAYTFNPDGISKLVVSTVPKKGIRGIPINSSITAITANETWDVRDDGKDVPETCQDLGYGSPTYRCLKEILVNYTLIHLTKPEDFVEVCENGMCCTLNYTTDGLKEELYLGVYNGTNGEDNRYFYSEENCVLFNGRHPSVPDILLRPRTVFKSVALRADFTTDFVFPSVLASGVRLVPRSEWTHRKLGNSEVEIEYKSSTGRELILVGLKGRCFDKDPPFDKERNTFPMSIGSNANSMLYGTFFSNPAFVV